MEHTPESKLPQSSNSDRTMKGRLLVFSKGLVMGVADSVPGVSGGTIAVIAGIYEELINSLKTLTPMALPILWREGAPAFWRHINGSFLLALLLGIMTSLYLSANTVLYLLEEHYPLIMAFFCGLVIASSWFLLRQVGQWSVSAVLLCVLGAGLTLLVSLINPLAGNYSYGYLFFCGMLAICAMILPGISGAFILLLLGVYDFVLSALRALDIGVIIVFASGCAIGLLSFAHLLSWTFERYRRETYAFLTGMLLASVVVLWPWKLSPDEGETAAVFLTPSGFENATGQSADVIFVMLLVLVGYVLVAFFERITRNQG